MSHDLSQIAASHRPTGWLVLVGVTAFPPTVAAQSVEGRLVDRQGEVAVADAFVTLADSTGREWSRAPTDSAGRFLLTAPLSGRYTLGVERIGYHVAETPDVRVRPGTATRYQYEATFTPVTLSAGETTCAIDGDSAAGAAWWEVRKALAAIRWTAARREYRYGIRTYRRQVARDGQRVERQTDAVSGDQSAVPFNASDPDVVAAEGYADIEDGDRLTYYSPGPRSLLDPRFQATHCFTPFETESQRLGLSFEPVPGTELADIRGTFWIDRATANLVGMEYRYTAEPSGIDDPRVGGSLRVARLPGAERIVSEWRLRMPSVMQSNTSEAAPELLGFHDQGGDVIDVRTADGVRLYANQSVAVLMGSVFDSTSGAPLEGAVVSLAGTRYWAATDARGEFVLAGDLNGEYRLVFGHPRLDSLGFVSPATPVTLNRFTTAGATLAVPPLRAVLDDRCEGLSRSANRMLVGVVRDPVSSRPVPGAAVAVASSLVPEHLRRFNAEDQLSTAVTDELGMYTLCHIPAGRRIVVNATAGQRISDFVPVLFGEGTVQYGEGSLPVEVDHPVGRLDLVLHEPTNRVAGVTGVVTSVQTGQAIAGAVVQVDRTPIATETDARGSFTLVGVPQGRIQVVVRSLGHRPLRRDLTIEGETVIALPLSTFEMERAEEVTTLDPVVVEATPFARYMADFNDRRATGVGSFATREDFEKWNPAVPTDVLRHMRGVRVTPNDAYGTNGDSRRFLIRSSRDVGSRITRLLTSNAERTESFNGGQSEITECPMLLFLDAMFIGDSRTTNVDNILSANVLEAVEVYSTSQVPPRFSLQGSTCGVIAFWTR